MNRTVHGCVFAAVLTFATTLGAQVQPSPTLPRQIPPTPRAQERPREIPETQTTRLAAVTVEGCLVREEDVPGRKPKATDKAATSEDYILTSAKMVTGTAPAVSASGSRVVTQMYEVEGLDKDQLKPHVGRRVQIDGSLEHIDRVAASSEEGARVDDLVEIKGSTIRDVAGDCPTK
jgi:hypothetical protein